MQVVVSDHGMTENGNHGGSSYEETDSLAIFIGLNDHVHDHASSNYATVSQVIQLHSCLWASHLLTQICQAFLPLNLKVETAIWTI